MKRILIAPMDWGLGHATRCIPIIRELLVHRCVVMIAGSGSSLELLKEEFPDLQTFVLPGYDPKYPANSAMVWKMSLQLPKFLNVIRKEHRLIEKIVQEQNLDIIIADNRYGCWSAKVYSVLITHQSNIMMPRRFGWLASIVRRVNETQMKKFKRCWLPDHPDNSLAGELISFGKIRSGIKVDYIGSLSRFLPGAKREKHFDVAAIFSGPEPQRSILDRLVSEQLKNSNLHYHIVRGRPGKKSDSKNPHVSEFLNTEALQQLIESSEIVIVRSGYSTIMDLAVLGKKAIFIPTPGQTEQEYLADRLMKMKIAFSMPQQRFDLKVALSQSKHYHGFHNFVNANELLKNAIHKLLSIK